MSRNSDIGLADFLLTLEALSPSSSDIDTRFTIAKLLGLTLPVSIKKSGKSRSRKISKQTPTHTSQTHETPSNLTEKIQPSIPFTIEKFNENTGETDDNTAQWLAKVMPIDKPPKERPSPMATHPLFRPEWERGILQAAFSLQLPDGPVVLEDIVETIARGRALKTIPRSMSWAVRQELHILIDQSRSFAPFQNDLKQLKDAILDLIPEDQCSFWNFNECPPRGVRKPGQRHFQPFYLPRQNQVVVVITDLALLGSVGESNPATEDEWIKFGKGVREANCLLVVFAPFAPEKIPLAIRSVMRPIMWDQPTTIIDVMRERRNEKWL